ncbi:MAG: NAD-dependent epimerase/dehydratase family protein [Solirubrobacteraceae bacterium]
MGRGLASRYGGFYGPGTAISPTPDAQIAAPVRKRRFPIVGDGGGVWSHIHIDDAATATVAAVDRGEPGIYNIVDDEPAPVREWLPVLANALDAKPPRRIPRWLGRLAGGERCWISGRARSSACLRCRLSAETSCSSGRSIPGAVVIGNAASRAVRSGSSTACSSSICVSSAMSSGRFATAR